MSLGQQLAVHLPFLRRYARALTGNQRAGDAAVHATLAALVANPGTFPGAVDHRVGLYRAFHTTLALEHGTAGGTESATANERLAHARLRRIAPASRQALLLTAMEGFTVDDAAYVLSLSADQVTTHLDEALREIDAQTRTDVLIVEDEPMIAMDLETIVRDLGHGVTGVAVTRDEAVAAARTQRPGLVLADIQLADDSSGIDAVQDILSEISVPVIFITAFPERLLTGERPEPTFLITKPFQRATVKAAIAQALFFDAGTVPA